MARDAVRGSPTAKGYRTVGHVVLVLKSVGQSPLKKTENPLPKPGSAKVRLLRMGLITDSTSQLDNVLDGSYFRGAQSPALLGSKQA